MLRNMKACKSLFITEYNGWTRKGSAIRWISHLNPYTEDV